MLQKIKTLRQCERLSPQRNLINGKVLGVYVYDSPYLDIVTLLPMTNRTYILKRLKFSVLNNFAKTDTIFPICQVTPLSRLSHLDREYESLTKSPTTTHIY